MAADPKPVDTVLVFGDTFTGGVLGAGEMCGPVTGPLILPVSRIGRSKWTWWVLVLVGMKLAEGTHCWRH